MKYEELKSTVYERPKSFTFPEGCDDDVTRSVARALLDCYIETGEHVAYSDLLSWMDCPLENPRNLDVPLGRFAMACYANNVPLISALVVNKEKLLPGNGFFALFQPVPDEVLWIDIYSTIRNQVDSWPKAYWKKVRKCI